MQLRFMLDFFSNCTFHIDLLTPNNLRLKSGYDLNFKDSTNGIHGIYSTTMPSQ